jgi:hypothetical protein
MWDDRKRQRFTELRRREEDGTLSDAQRAELAALTGEILDLESAYLGPAAQRLRQQRENFDAQNRRLEALVARKAALAERLQNVLSEAAAERHAIEGEVESVLAGGQDPRIGA